MTLYRLKSFIAEMMLDLACVGIRRLLVDSERNKAARKHEMTLVYLTRKIFSLVGEEKMTLAVPPLYILPFFRSPIARLTLGLENPIYSPTSIARTYGLFCERISIVSRYISPDSCKCIKKLP